MNKGVNYNGLLKKEVALVTNKATPITIDILPKSWLHRKLMEWRIMPRVKRFSLRPVSLGTLAKISSLAVDMVVDKTQPESGWNGWAFEHADKYIDHNIMIIAHAIHNQESDPPEHLVKFIRWNLCASDIFALTSMIIDSLDLEPFITTTIALSRINILKDPDEPNGLETTGEIIASGEELESLKSIFGGATVISSGR